MHHVVTSRDADSLAHAPNSRIRGEYPPEALRALAEQAREAEEHAHAKWVTGVPFLKATLDASRPLSGLVVAEAVIRRRAAVIGRPSAVLAIGLELRADHAHLYRSDWEMFWRLRYELGAEMPSGIAVCEDCRWVFRTARKRAASKCPRCHKRSSRAEREPWHLAVIEEDTFDAAGLPSGWKRRYLVQCVACPARFWTSRRDRKTCSPRCRVRAHRKAA
jgi:hypothetical protein